MAHFGFMTLNVMGHLYPMSALAKHLKGRGHRVTFFAFADAEAFLRETGLECAVFGREGFPLGYTRRAVDTLSRMKGMEGFRYTVETLCKEIGAQLDELPEAVKAAGVEALVIDQFLMGGSTVADYLQTPYMHVANALVGNLEPDVPPISFGWGNESGLIAMLRNRFGHAVVRKIFRPVRETLNERRRAWGLPLYEEFMNERFGSGPQISQEPPSFEFPRRELPRNFSYVGPLQDRSSRAEVAFPWERIDGRPLIYASMGTLQNGLAWVFEAILKGCTGVDAQLVLSTGGNLDPAQFSSLPDGAIVVKYAPQMDLLKRATLCITHGGLNTILESLARGVPLVVVPMTNDQPAAGVRVAWTGVGRVVPVKMLKPDSLRGAVNEVMSKATYRENARRLQTEIAGMDSLERAGEIVESVLRIDSSRVGAIKGA